MSSKKLPEVKEFQAFPVKINHRQTSDAL